MRIYTTLPCISKDDDTGVVTRYEHDLDLSTVCGYYPAFGEDHGINVDLDNGDGVSVDMPMEKFREIMKQAQKFIFVWYNG